MLEQLRQEVLEANLRLEREGLVKLTWGNVSGIDRPTGCVIIKPSGVPYAALTPESLVAVDLDGHVLAGEHRPSSDTATHLALYRAFPTIGGITHTHSHYATLLAQAGLELPCYGTTHADHFYGTVPLVRELTQSEVNEDYEKNTGLIIASTLSDLGLDPLQVPGCLQSYHAPFTWGSDAMASVDNAVALEVCAQMYFELRSLAPDRAPLPRHILDKHFLRKHGPGAYYGQNS